MTSLLDENPKLLLSAPHLCRDEAVDQVLFEFARASHGAQWRQSISKAELDLAISNQSEYDKGLEALEQFAPGWMRHGELPPFHLAVDSLVLLYRRS